MADEIKEALNVETKLIPGSSGIFDVKVDGKMVFSKYLAGRFPDAGEVVAKIKNE